MACEFARQADTVSRKPAEPLEGDSLPSGQTEKCNTEFMHFIISSQQFFIYLTLLVTL